MPSAREVALDLFNAAIAAVEPAAAVRAHLTREGDHLRVGTWEHRLTGRVVVIGAGKASAPMAQAVEALLHDRISHGVVVVKYDHGCDLRPDSRIVLHEAAHPVPDAAGIAGAQRVEQALSGLRADDLVICCLSGGASALLPAPRNGITLADKQEVTRLLQASGADIHALNTVRKHLARLKGGRLALTAQPATVLTLAISDVIGDAFTSIGSGPTAADPSTDADAWAVLSRWIPSERIPPGVRAALSGNQAYTLKPGDPALARVHNVIVASNAQALAAAAARARALGLVPIVESELLSGEASAAAAAFVQRAGALLPGHCRIAGGETTVKLGPAPGRGGRNQEFALAAAKDLSKNLVVIA
ncbi:MAG: glycerate kinase, partial [Planctomycetota bacterium]